nr:MAG TPA: hypothetical protein [Caudoviricetes sp.]
MIFSYSKEVSNSFIRRKEISRFNLLTKALSAFRFRRVENIKYRFTAMINNSWLTILINYFRCVFWIILPITKPIFKLFSSYLSV